MFEKKKPKTHHLLTILYSQFKNKLIKLRFLFLLCEILRNVIDFIPEKRARNL